MEKWTRWKKQARWKNEPDGKTSQMEKRARWKNEPDGKNKPDGKTS